MRNVLIGVAALALISCAHTPSVNTIAETTDTDFANTYAFIANSVNAYEATVPNGSPSWVTADKIKHDAAVIRKNEHAAYVLSRPYLGPGLDALKAQALALVTPPN